MKEKEKITVVVKEPHDILKVVEVDHTTDAFNDIVGGWFEVIDLPFNVDMVLNEEGKILNLEPNIFIGWDVVVGTVFFVIRDGENWKSLDDIQKVVMALEEYRKNFTLEEYKNVPIFL